MIVLYCIYILNHQIALNFILPLFWIINQRLIFLIRPLPFLYISNNAYFSFEFKNPIIDDGFSILVLIPCICSFSYLV